MMQKLKLKTLFSEKTLAKRIAELAAEMDKDLPQGEEIVFIGVLKGSLIFLADLIRQLPNRNVKVEFIGVASYEGTESTGHVRITSDLSADIKNKNVIVVEDIVDTGMTIDFLMDTLKVRGPKSLKICALLSKPDAHIMHNVIDYVGFEIAKEFVVGYGLDLDGAYRQLPYVAQVEV